MPHNASPAALICVNTQHDLLSHGPSRHEDGRGLAEQVGHLRLEILDDSALAVSIRSGVVRNPSQKLARRTVPMAIEEPSTTSLQLFDSGSVLVLVGSHRRKASYS